jgi:hypothetical protein
MKNLLNTQKLAALVIFQLKFSKIYKRLKKIQNKKNKYLKYTNKAIMKLLSKINNQQKMILGLQIDFFFPKVLIFIIFKKVRTYFLKKNLILVKIFPKMKYNNFYLNKKIATNNNKFNQFNSRLQL